MTRTTVRMVLVNGVKADGLTLESEVFDTTAEGGAPPSNASELVSAAILGTQQSALASDHHVIVTGVTWSDPNEAVVLRESLTAQGVEDVTLVPELRAAAALAQGVGQAVGYDTMALLFITKETATLCAVETAGGSMVKVLGRRLDSADAMPALTGIVATLEARESQPQGLFVVGSGVDVGAVKSHLEKLVTLPVIVPEDPEMALARGAALTAANAPHVEASTSAMAYSLDPDGETAVTAASVSGDADTQQAPVARAHTDETSSGPKTNDAGGGRKSSTPVGSLVAAIFVISVVALVMSIAVSAKPTADRSASLGQNAILPSTVAPAPPPVEEAQPTSPAPAALQPPPETIPKPVPVVQEAPQPAPQQAAPRTVLTRDAALRPQTPAPAAPPPAPAPAAPPPAPAPAAPLPVPIDVPAAPAPVLPPPAAPPPVILPPILQLPILQLLSRPGRVYSRPPQQIPQQQWPQTPPPQQIPQQQSQYPQYPQQQWPQTPPPQQIPQYPPQDPQYPSQQWPQTPPQQIPQYPQYPSQQWPQSAPQQQQAPQYRPGSSDLGRDGPLPGSREPGGGSRFPFWPYPGD
ncbi:hypothetical protein [Mycobacterium sp.]|uniref:DUF7159 family protein n=1 Tax=Mycobacterium sp. TaxID=1785 RepID=UPI00333F9C06